MAEISYTTVNHVARKKLGLSVNEYAVADLIFNLQSNPDGDGWCYASKQWMGDQLGITKRSVNYIVARLVERGLVEIKEDKLNNSLGNKIKMTFNWYGEVMIKGGKSVPTNDERWEKDSRKVGKDFPERWEKISHNKDNNNKDSNKDDIYTPILDHWNSKEIVKHRKLTEKMKRSINGRLRDGFTEQEIIQSIDNYDIILKGKEYFWNYKWTLQDFLQRGFEKFLDGDIARQNYKKGGTINGYENANRAKEGKYDNIEYEN